METFKALLIEKGAGGAVSCSLTHLTPEQLDDGELTIKVHYSSINYKDALAATGVGKVIRRFPCIGGIDLVGEVVASTDSRFNVGTKVIATSFDIGVSHHGGYAELARIPSKWALALPSGLTTFEAMALGTAGFTAALGILRMEANGLKPENGPVVVTGASGGVGGLAVNMLSQLGYHTVALTGKATETDKLLELGASEVMLTSSIDLEKVRPLETGLWSGAVDNVGGRILHWLLATMRQAGTVASIGNAASAELDTTVFPFILRGVSLLGVDSGYMQFPLRAEVWNRLATDLKPRHLAAMTRTIEFEQLPKAFDDFVQGHAKGRTVVKVAS
ncbi:oxidoreductase [Hydrogenophaga sp. 2FB]|uniref:oxidoreductase n=1 Tax=Hydrogenophaga sp. 2FB TaxID=2502187 RepID=UPI0010F7A165|nr:oxidoreductase [Hydrogenophaga sp. 2FB]